MMDGPILTERFQLLRVDWFRDDRCRVTRLGKEIGFFDGDRWSNDELLTSTSREWALSFRDEANRRTLDEGAW